MRVVIGGAGIGGLTAALALRARGAEAVVLERAERLEEVGAGIVMWPNAVRVLGSLGLGDALLAAGARVTSGGVRDPGGRVLSATPVRELDARLGVPSVALHRADLQRVLVEALEGPGPGGWPFEPVVDGGTSGRDRLAAQHGSQRLDEGSPGGWEPSSGGRRSEPLDEGSPGGWEPSGGGRRSEPLDEGSPGVRGGASLAGWTASPSPASRPSPPGLELGAEVVSIAQGVAGVSARLAGGGEHSGDALVGADGLGSRVREAIVGPRPPRYAGYTAWRGVARTAGLASGSGFETWGRGRRFGALDIGGGRTYWYATESTPEGGRDLDARTALLARFGGWHEPIGALIDATPSPTILRHDVVHLPALPVWSVSRATLLGDAAHAMTPDLGQGACQAIEDAWVLADCLAGAADVPDALRAYESRRRGRADAFARGSLWAGRVAQASRPRLCRARDAAMRATPTAASRRTFERILGAASAE